MNVRLLLPGLLLVATAGFANGQTDVAARAASVSYLEGQVTIDGRPAEIGDPVPLGATVTTVAQSLCDIVFTTKNIIHLAENTIFVFDPSNLQRGSELKQGTLILVLKRLSTAGGPRFTVRTASTVAGVRGTEFFIRMLDPKTTYFCCCNGAIHVEDPAGKTAKDVETSHHKAWLFTATDAGVSVTDAAMLYHTDSDVEQVAAKIGVNIDWTVVDR